VTWLCGWPGKDFASEFCLVGSEKQGQLPAIFSKIGEPMLPEYLPDE